MPYGTYLSAAGARAQSHRMEVLSHNLANVETPGFKPQSTVLQSRFAEMIERGDVSPGPDGQGYDGIDRIGGGVTVQPTVTDYGVGSIRQTGRRTDFAINDDTSFFTVRRGDDLLLSRAGNFLFDASGTLVNQNGDQVLDTAGDAVRIDPSLPYRVAPGGWIHQAERTVGLMLARPQSVSDLEHTGDNFFVPTRAVDPVPDDERRVANNAIEMSGVKPTAAMMELVETSRVYEANVRMIQNQDTVTGSLLSRVLS